MRIIYSFLICFFCSAAANAQQEWPLQVALSSNATSLPPGILTRLFTDPLHPGITLGTEYSYRKKRRHEWFQTARLGYFYHRENQHAIQAYTELGYRGHTPSRLDIGLLIGGGYHHSIRDDQLLRRNSSGTYEKITNWGQPHAMFTSGLETGYTTTFRKRSTMRIFIGYQFWVQTPFVSDIVPVLPHTTLRIGTSLPKRKTSLN